MFFVAKPVVPVLFDPLPVVSDESSGLVRPMERAALWASITAIHTVCVSKERLSLADRSWASEPMALPSRIPLYSYMSVTGENSLQNPSHSPVPPSAFRRTERTVLPETRQVLRLP